MDSRLSALGRQLGRLALLVLAASLHLQAEAVALSGTIHNRLAPPGQPITAPQAAVAFEVGESSVSGFGGTATYTGSLGPVSAEHIICICVASDPTLHNLLGCFEVRVNGGRYDVVTMDTSTYYLVGFLDINANIALDPGEPYEIYNHRSMPPGDPVVAGPAQTAINFIFGDENLSPDPTPTATVTPTAAATASPTETVTASATATLTPSASPTETSPRTPTATASPRPACVGDCDGSNDVTLGELIIMVNVALGNAGLADCPAGDADGSGDITVNEIIAAVNAALNGCPG